MTGDARGYSWPPFAPGNDIATRHGANSERLVAPIAREMADEMMAQAAWLNRPAFSSEVWAWAWAEARVRLLRDYIDIHGLLDGDGVPIPALAALDRAEGRAQSLRQSLGLGPLGLARLLASLTQAARGTDETGDELEAVRAEGRRLVEARTVELAAPLDPTQSNQSNQSNDEESTRP